MSRRDLIKRLADGINSSFLTSDITRLPSKEKTPILQYFRSLPLLMTLHPILRKSNHLSPGRAVVFSYKMIVDLISLLRIEGPNEIE